MKTSPNHLAAWVKKHGQVSESTLALTFAEYQGEQWCYNTDEGMWLRWVETHWARRRTPELMEALRHFLMVFAKAFQQGKHITLSEANKLQSQRALAAIERLCRTLPSFLTRSELFDNDPFLLGTPGGTVDMRTGEMRAANPADYITVLTTVAPAPPGTPCPPRFKKFLDDITSNDEDFQLTLQMWFGMSATGTSRDQRILFLYGPGGNGKGVLLRTVAGILGSEYAVNAPRDLLMMQKYSQHTTHLVDVLNARMAITTEVDEDATWDIALVKDLTGGDKIQVQRMRQDPFRLVVRCYITISGNRRPALKGIDDAVRRRFLVATFTLKVAPEAVIVDLEKEFIAEEGPAILRWIIDGAVARETAGRLHVAQVIRDDTEEYFAEEDVMKDFIGEWLKPAPAGADPVWRVKTAEVFQAWKDYCGQSRRKSGAQNSFTTAMVAAGVEYKRTEDGRYFVNVRLRSPMEI